MVRKESIPVDETRQRFPVEEIPPMKCPKCGEMMEYRGGPSDSNLYVMVCPNPDCQFQTECYPD